MCVGLGQSFDGLGCVEEIGPTDNSVWAPITTSILDSTLLLYAVFINLNRFRLAILYIFMIVSSYFHFYMHVLLFFLLFVQLIFTLLITLLHVRLLLAFNKYSILK